MDDPISPVRPVESPAVLEAKRKATAAQRARLHARLQRICLDGTAKKSPSRDRSLQIYGVTAAAVGVVALGILIGLRLHIRSLLVWSFRILF